MKDLTRRSFRQSADQAPEPPSKDDHFTSTIQHLMKTNIEGAYRAAASDDADKGERLQYYLYGPTGLIANFTSLGLNPALPESYEDVSFDKDQILKLYQILHRQNPQIDFSIYELPQDVLDLLSDKQRKSYRKSRNEQAAIHRQSIHVAKPS